MGKRTFMLRAAWAVMALLATVIPAFSQTILPPIAEYRGKGNGMVELRNDGDVPLAVIVEVKGFSVNEEGRMAYVGLDPSVKVELGASSFVIPPRQSHLVFYKAEAPATPFWFAILATFTKAAPARNEMRVNIVLPHVVYVYQRHRLKKKDVQLALSAGLPDGYRLEVRNVSSKASRLETIECKGFERPVELGGVPLFPAKTRFVELDSGAARAKHARCKVSFEEGFSLEVAPEVN